jgi:hypothetical protein
MVNEILHGSAGNHDHLERTEQIQEAEFFKKMFKFIPNRRVLDEGWEKPEAFDADVAESCNFHGFEE